MSVPARKRHVLDKAFVLITTLFFVATSACQQIIDYEVFQQGPPRTTHRCDSLGKVQKTGLHGPLLDLIKYGNASDEQDCFWMDDTEVTVAQYMDWLSWASSNDVQWPAQCDTNKSSPSNPTLSADECSSQIPSNQVDPFVPESPIRCVDWCDATMYCQFAGKRLCYVANDVGGTVPRGNANEWYYACSNNETTTFSTKNNELAADGCNVAQDPVECVALPGVFLICGPSKSENFNNCRASLQSPVNLSGNVAEWVNLCAGNEPNSLCRILGGSYESTVEQSACLVPAATRRLDRDPSVGFRCCADLDPDERVTLPPQLLFYSTVRWYVMSTSKFSGDDFCSP